MTCATSPAVSTRRCSPIRASGPPSSAGRKAAVPVVGRGRRHRALPAGRRGRRVLLHPRSAEEHREIRGGVARRRSPSRRRTGRSRSRSPTTASGSTPASAPRTGPAYLDPRRGHRGAGSPDHASIRRRGADSNPRIAVVGDPHARVRAGALGSGGATGRREAARLDAGCDGRDHRGDRHGLGRDRVAHRIEAATEHRRLALLHRRRRHGGGRARVRLHDLRRPAGLEPITDPGAGRARRRLLLSSSR